MKSPRLLHPLVSLLPRHLDTVFLDFITELQHDKHEKKNPRWSYFELFIHEWQAGITVHSVMECASAGAEGESFINTEFSQTKGQINRLCSPKMNGEEGKRFGDIQPWNLSGYIYLLG